jgi:hypothetical protein
MLPYSGAVKAAVGFGAGYSLAAKNVDMIDDWYYGKPIRPFSPDLLGAFGDGLSAGPLGPVFSKYPRLAYPALGMGAYSSYDSFSKKRIGQGLLDLGATAGGGALARKQIAQDLALIGKSVKKLTGSTPQGILGSGPVLPGGPNVPNQPITTFPGQGPQLMTTLNRLNTAALSNGPTVEVFTRLGGALNPAQPLSLSVGSPTLSANLPNPSAQAWYHGRIPRALVQELEAAGLVRTPTTRMGRGVGTELEVLPPGTLWVVDLLSPCPAPLGGGK